MKLLKMIFRILFAPVELVLRLMIGLLAFLVSISTSLLSIAASLFLFMAVLMFIVNSIQSGLIYLLLALLVSPMGLPALADHLLNGLDFVLTKISDIACCLYPEVGILIVIPTPVLYRPVCTAKETHRL